MKSTIDLKVGVITSQDPNDKRILSGTLYSMCEALKKEFSYVVYLGPVKLSMFESINMRVGIVLFKLFHILAYRKKVNSEHINIKSRVYGRYFDRKISQLELDILFAPLASIEVARLKTEIPVCYLSDTSFAQISEYYQVSDNVSSLVKKMGDKIEQAAIDNSSAQVYSSNWAADFSKFYYNAPNTFVVKFGANINSPGLPDLTPKKLSPSIQLLFVGVDWVRKGGNIVFDTFLELLAKGYDVNLTVCGCIPPKQHPKVKVFPFLDKNKEEDLNVLIKLFRQSDLLFLPTRADCTPIVFCEANAFGLPVLTTNTGGVSSIIENNVNGILLSLEARSKEYTEAIEALIRNKGLYQSLSENALKKSQNELNWNAWAKKMKKIFLLSVKEAKNEIHD